MQKLENYTNQADSLRKTFHTEIERLKADETLSAVGKQQQADTLHVETAQKLTNLRKSYHSTIDETRQSLTDKAFKFSGTTAEKLSFDETVFRLSQKEVKPNERLARLQQGSPETAMAVVKSAYIAGDRKTLEGFEGKYPDKVKPIAELMDFEQQYGNNRNASTKMAESMIFRHPTMPNFR